MNKAVQTIKLVIISLILLVGITYITVDKPKNISDNKNDITLLPKKVELIGFDDQEFTTNSILKKNTLVFIGNNQSIKLSNQLNTILNLELGKFVTVSNVSNEPWFIKRWQAHTANTKLKGDNPSPWIYDRDGDISSFFKVPTANALKYFIYYINSEGDIELVYSGDMKNEKMTEEKITRSLQLVSKDIRERVRF